MASYITIDRQKFRVSTDTRTNTTCISSIHPYDETEYHWARRNPKTNKWDIFRDGRRITSLFDGFTDEQMAEMLLRYDNRFELRPRICKN